MAKVIENLMPQILWEQLKSPLQNKYLDFWIILQMHALNQGGKK